MGKFGSKKLESKKDISELLGMDTTTGTCSIQNITINDDSSLIKSTDMGNVDDEYDPGF